MRQAKTLQITLLGATGSIGKSTLDVVARHPGRYQIYALTANTNVKNMLSLCELWKPRYAVMNDANSAADLSSGLLAINSQTEVLSDES